MSLTSNHFGDTLVVESHLFADYQHPSPPPPPPPPLPPAPAPPKQGWGLGSEAESLLDALENALAGALGLVNDRRAFVNVFAQVDHHHHHLTEDEDDSPSPAARFSPLNTGIAEEELQFSFSFLKLVKDRNKWII
ncbi:hypothetical protein M0804_000582 [Polistes exclamans]|nr:hypothetical protein M0804_000582 [Polistes exclamans]